MNCFFIPSSILGYIILFTSNPNFYLQGIGSCHINNLLILNSTNKKCVNAKGETETTVLLDCNIKMRIELLLQDLNFLLCGYKNEVFQALLVHSFIVPHVCLILLWSYLWLEIYSQV